MALIKCNECGKEISDSAKICPNCGIAINNKSNKIIKKNNINKIFLIIMILYSVYTLYQAWNGLEILIGYFDMDYSYTISKVQSLTNLIYIIGSCALLWILLLYKNYQNNTLKNIALMIFIAMIFFDAIYTIVWIIEYGFSLDLITYIFMLLVNKYAVFTILYLIITKEKKNVIN